MEIARFKAGFRSDAPHFLMTGFNQHPYTSFRSVNQTAVLPHSLAIFQTSAVLDSCIITYMLLNSIEPDYILHMSAR
jgi:hypothetical protein